MNCKRAKAEIALWVGGDLIGAAVIELRRHLLECTGCREHRQQMETSLRFLQEPDEVPILTISGSVWPDLASRLPSREKMWSLNRFNGWVPATLIAASCVVILYSAFRAPLNVQSFESPVVQPMPVVEMPINELLRPPLFHGKIPVDETQRQLPRQRKSDPVKQNSFPQNKPLIIVPLDIEN